jgi:hypothetical protein
LIPDRGGRKRVGEDGIKTDRFAGEKPLSGGTNTLDYFARQKVMKKIVSLLKVGVLAKNWLDLVEVIIMC